MIEYQCYIIAKNGEYLVAAPYPDTLTIRWSSSPYDGYRVNRYRLAKMIADKVGGRVVEFNPVNGSVIQ